MSWLVPFRTRETERPLSSSRLLDTLWEPFDLEPLFGTVDMAPVDLTETDDEYKMRVELPGLEKDEVKISLNQNVLTISGEKKEEEAKENESFHKKEIRYGWFERSFTLPGDVDESKIKAKMKNGVLTIRVPKSESAKPKRIPITVQ